MASVAITDPKSTKLTLEQEAHALDEPSVTRALAVDPSRGLTLAETLERRKHYGPNSLQTIRPRPAWRTLLHAILSLIVALLAAAR
jgi:magnesium-transporting ATPase (P-type)